MPAVPRLCAIDLDDTLLGSSHVLSRRNRSAIENASQTGMIILLASGRMYGRTLPYARELDLTTPIVCYNGAMVRTPSGETWLHDRVPPDCAATIRRYALEQDLQLNYYLDDHLYTRSLNRWTELYALRTGADFEVVPDFDRELEGTSPTKAIFVMDPDAAADLMPRMRELYQGRLNILRSNSEYLEFLPHGADKGQALKATASRMGVPREQVAAIGDSWNDLAMLEWAGIPIAVANAKPEVKAVALCVVPSNDEDGVAVALEEMVRS